MPSRAPAFPKDFRAPVIFDALKGNARQLILLSLFIALATFAALSMLAPQPPGFVSLQLSAIAGVAALLFGAAWIVAMTALRNMPQRQVSGFSTRAKKSSKQPLTSIADDPILRDMTDAEAAAAPKVDEPEKSAAMQSAVDDLVAQSHSADTFTEIEKLAAHLKEHRPSGGGHRTLVTSAIQSVTPFSEALMLSKALADSGAQTILIDWSPSGEGFASAVGIETRIGWNDLLMSGARFNEIIQRLPGSRAQVIASGMPFRNASMKIDIDLLNLALDALDEVYDHIIVTARHDEARALFESIEGRFDAGITVVPIGETPSSPEDANVFLGFEVADIDLLRFQKLEPSASAIAQRIARATRQRETTAQPA